MTDGLSPAQRSFLRSRAHTLPPRVNLGKKGADEAFHRLLEGALEADELVKVRLGRHVEVDLDAVAVARSARVVGKVGRNAIFYRPQDPPRLKLPAASGEGTA